MSDLTKLIQQSVKENKIIFGYKQTIKAIKVKKPELIVFANNFPKEKRESIEHNAKMAKVAIKEFDKDSVNLGLICGKPFSVGILAIKGGKK